MWLDIEMTGLEWLEVSTRAHLLNDETWNLWHYL